uniref:pentatricopeptide repeat-containing protein At1g71210, mitochondrial-like n=1 Tax=Erigeron canadensis TaxID=72917 RepID=UPI001CB963AB|nr:pentatricopeptide repeat-containing protein At1g71210, mitochondrial-like [Erigeron canadensis]
MVRIRYLKQTSIRALFSPNNNINVINYSTVAAASATKAVYLNPLYSSNPSPVKQLHAEDVAATFQGWFKSTRNPFYDRILHVLSSHSSVIDGENDDVVSQREALDAGLSQLNLHLTESLVLDVLYCVKDVLSCLKFFDWAGRQPGFVHTRATFSAIFKILSRAKLMSLMLEYLDNTAKHRGSHKTNFQTILVMGYAVAGKPDLALQLYGRMRYEGIDLDDFAYHVLLNALVEESYYDGVDSVAKQIKFRGFESEVTHSILVKGFCKKRDFDRAETYVRGVMDNGTKFKNRGYIVGALIEGLCKNDQFDKAGKLVDEYGEFHVYDVWIRELVRVRKLDGAMNFLQKRKKDAHYVPDVFRHNALILRLLRENRLEEVCDLIIEMKENNLPPDELTMNIVLCFFCKAGMVDVAVRLYDTRGDIGLSLSSMAFNCLINTLCGDGSVVDAYRVLKTSLDQGYLPRVTTFSILADALCKLEKLELMSDLFVVALENNVVLTDKVIENYIKVLCKTGKVEHGYFVLQELNRLNIVITRGAYNSLIDGFIKLKRGDIAARLLINMQEKGHTPSRPMFRAVIQSVCEMENPERQFQKLLELQSSLRELDCGVFNIFIEGAGHAKKPDLARELYRMMKKSRISPNVVSDILMLKCYLNNGKVSDAVDFFNDILKRRKIGRKVCNAMVIGLCKSNKPDLALGMFLEIREKEKTVRPSLECYEELIYVLCKHKRYKHIVDLINDLIRVRRPVSSYIGNNLLLHSLKDRKLYDTWVDSGSIDESSPIWKISEIVGLFSDRFRDDIDANDLEEVVGNCFPLDMYTYNMLLRKLSVKQLDDAHELFQKLRRKGYEPNQWTYETLVHGFHRHGKKSDAKWWVAEMIQRGFHPSQATRVLL